MGQTLRVENAERVGLITVRAQGSQLVFANNPALEQEFLVKLARYQSKYNAELYAFAFAGSHHQSVARFPELNRAQFMRDLNSAGAKAVKRALHSSGGKIWERRYAEHELPRDEDIEYYVLYCALQAVQDGITRDVRKSKAYNSFWDAIRGIEREIADVDWTAYHNAKRFNPAVDIAQYTTIRKLKFSRLPGYADLSQEEYERVMTEKLLRRQDEVVQQRLAHGLGFKDETSAKPSKPTDFAKSPKKSTRYARYPIVLTSCPRTRQERLEIYFAVRAAHREASIEYLKGNTGVVFPVGTYVPPLLRAA